MIRIKYNLLKSTFVNILINNGFNESNAELCAKIFTENSLVGVSSHGVNRFEQFIQLVKSEHILPNAEPTLENSFNALEQWNGNYGAGPLNAHKISKRAIEISNQFGIGCVALKNTNHWMRPGYYAWEAAESGFIFICWTNTIPIMPPWGGKEPKVGNNPIVFGVPRKNGNIVIDMALSQYSYGKLSTYAMEDRELPFAGGYDKNDNLTKNANEIKNTQRSLPVGYWKGSGLSLLLDLIATILSGGKSTFELSRSEIDSGMSQVYIAIDPKKFISTELIDNAVNEIVEYYKSSEVIEGEEILYPGERVIQTKRENLKNGIPINKQIWQNILKLES